MWYDFDLYGSNLYLYTILKRRSSSYVNISFLNDTHLLGVHSTSYNFLTGTLMTFRYVCFIIIFYGCELLYFFLFQM